MNVAWHPAFNLNLALNSALEATKVACSIIRNYQEHLVPTMIQRKNIGDIGTIVDQKSENAIRAHLSAVFPDFAFMGEESGHSGRSRMVWIVDPLDGTMNYVHKFPFYAVSIALAVEDRIVLGVVADPLRQETFWAVEGRGAFLNGTPLRVSTVERMDEALVSAVVPPPSWPDQKEVLHHFCRVAIHAAGIRRSGAAALDLAYVAAGRLDAFFVESLHIWDIAAGMLLVTEAEGMIADTRSSASPLVTNRLAAANAALLPSLRQLLC